MSTLAPSFLIGSSSYLQVTRTSITSRTSGENGVITFSPLFLIGFFSYLQVMRTCIYKSLNEFEIRPDATTGFHGNHRVIMGKMLCPL